MVMHSLSSRRMSPKTKYMIMIEGELQHISTETVNIPWKIEISLIFDFSFLPTAGRLQFAFFNDV
jgi:hypothetical protein